MQDINWKHVAKSPGYKSLKAAYIRDVKNSTESKRRSMRDKAEFLRKFQWVIARATHYAYKHNVRIEVILNEWEAARNYWWLNYYQDCMQPKIRKPIT